MDWIPIVFVAFKVLVLVTGMFFAIKWHYDQGKKEEGIKERRAVLRAGGKVAAIFLLLLVVLGYATFAVIRMIGL